jgi:hypothetical protein
MDGISIWGVLTAAAAAFVLGGIWYAPPVFGRAWQREAGLTDEALSARKPAAVFGISFVLSLVAAAVFAMFLGPRPGLGFALGAGLAAGVCWVSASFGINYLFEHRSMKLFAINGGYHTLQFALYGLALGLIH